MYTCIVREGWGFGSERFVHNVQEATALKEQRLGRGRGEVGRWLGAVEWGGPRASFIILLSLHAPAVVASSSVCTFHAQTSGHVRIKT